MVKARGKSKVSLKILSIGIAIGVIAIFGFLLFLGSHSSSSFGTEGNPYNATFGYQGQGYYAYHNGEFYATSPTQFNSSVSHVLPSTTTLTSTTPTTSVTVPTTNQCYGEIINIATYGNKSTSGNCSGYIVNIGTYGNYVNSNDACPSVVNIGTYGTYFNNVTGCTPSVNIGVGGVYYNVNTGNMPPVSTATTITTSTTTISYVTTTIPGSSNLQNQCSVTGSKSYYSGTTILITNGQTCSLGSNYYFTSSFTTYGPVELSGTFSTNGSSIEVYVVSQNELNIYKSTGSISEYQCTLGSVITGSINCEVPAGNWSILFINDNLQTSTVTYTSDVNVSYVYYAEQIPFDVINPGASWSLLPDYHEYESFNLNSPALITGGFTSSGAVEGYVMNSNEFANFNSTGEATGYYCTTGDVTSGSVGCAVPAGDWYFVIVNPSLYSNVNINWQDGLTAYGLLNGSTNDALYDEQFGLTFADSYTSLAYNVTATAQVDTSGIGPAYLLNGLSNEGYWYQVGLSYNWADGTQHYTGFNINYEVFAPDGTSIYPSGGGSGLLSLNGPVNNGDTVQLSLYFSNGDVIMYAKDLNTGASGYVSYSAEGASEFVGNPSSTQTNGFFTGLMTEWYHVLPWYGGGKLVTYNPYGAISSPAWLWVDEFYCYSQTCGGQTNSILLFFNSTSYTINPNYRFLSNGATLTYSDGGSFTTGS